MLNRLLACGTITDVICFRNSRSTNMLAISKLLPFKGFTKLHSLQLDLGENYDGGVSAAVAGWMARLNTLRPQACTRRARRACRRRRPMWKR